MNLLLRKIKVGMKLPGFNQTSPVSNNKVIVWLVSWGSLFLIASYYNSLFYQTLIFHIIKYTLVGVFVQMISRYRPISIKFRLNRRSHFFFKIILIGLTLWDTLAWCDFLKTKLFSSEQPQFFIASNLYNNEDIFPNYRYQLERFISTVGPKNVFISIVENFSDDSTPELLNNWAEHLQLIGVRHSIKTNYEMPERNSMNRIDRLAYLRNIALQPFFDPDSGFIEPDTINWNYKLNDTWTLPQLRENISKDSRVIFLNDVILFSENIISLINTNSGEYDAVCASDYQEDRIYDTWVMRDKDGHQLNPFYPHFHNTKYRNQWMSGQPIPMYSCWNAMVVFNPQLIVNYFSPQLIPIFPFSKDLPTFKSPKISPQQSSTTNLPGIRFRSRSHNTECYASECFYIWYDLHAKSPTPLKIYMTPNVKVYYSIGHYFLNRELFNWYIIRLFYRITFTSKFNHPLTIHRDARSFSCWKWFKDDIAFPDSNYIEED